MDVTFLLSSRLHVLLLLLSAVGFQSFSVAGDRGAFASTSRFSFSGGAAWTGGGGPGGEGRLLYTSDAADEERGVDIGGRLSITTQN